MERTRLTHSPDARSRRAAIVALGGALSVSTLALSTLALSTLALSTLAVGTAAASPSKKFVISSVSTAKGGRVLARNGATLYTLSGGMACDAQCLATWPAVTLPSQDKSATAGPGVTRAKLGVTSGPNGARQVTYGGHALYRYVGDTARGQVNGDLTDQWGKWTAVVTAKGSTGTSSGTDNGSSGTTAGSGGVSF